MDKPAVTAADYARGLTRHENNNRRFWVAYILASSAGTWTNDMLARAEVIQAKSSTATALFITSIQTNE